MSRVSPVRVSVVHGSPIRVLDRTLVPVVRLVSAHGHYGTIRAKSVEGTGWRAAHVRPLAVLEDHAGKARVLPIPDRTATVLWQMAVVAVVIPILATLLIVANRSAQSR